MDSSQFKKLNKLNQIYFRTLANQYYKYTLIPINKNTLFWREVFNYNNKKGFMMNVTKHTLPSCSPSGIAACCICEMQISGWWRHRAWDGDNGWKKSLLVTFHPLCKESAVILSSSVQTGHRGSHLARVCAAPALTRRRAEELQRERPADCSQFRRCVSRPCPPPPPLLYLHGAHTSTWSEAARWHGRPGTETRGWMDGGGCSVSGDKGTRCFNSGAGPGTNWIW